MEQYLLWGKHKQQPLTIQFFKHSSTFILTFQHSSCCHQLVYPGRVYIAIIILPFWIARNMFSDRIFHMHLVNLHQDQIFNFQIEKSLFILIFPLHFTSNSTLKSNCSRTILKWKIRFVVAISDYPIHNRQYSFTARPFLKTNFSCVLLCLAVPCWQ